ncbi:hypothetical protein [Fibrella arboris]|uniref:hypothetical protein n=1 Tax=Fibrella arboris TaxID=3242486 RepID=UPI003520B630
MTIKIKKGSAPVDVTQQISKVKEPKAFDVSKHAGKVKWEQDPLVYQRESRSDQ